jgi:elongation of very long chain fatty acids protein 6
MKNKIAYKCNNLLCIWNIILAIYSGISSYYMMPFLLQEIYQLGFKKSVCDNTYTYNDNISYIIVFFGLSKFMEFIDTLFIVLRKSKLEFLHYYHHIMTCIYTWCAIYINSSIGKYFTTINLLVHTLMYASLSFNITIFKKYKKLITTLQVIQMLFCIYIILYWIDNCKILYNIEHHIIHIMGLIMYYSYLLLFINLYITLYIKFNNSKYLNL